VKVSCEDGRDFIRDVVARSLNDPFPSYVSKLSLRQRQKEQKELAIARKILALPKSIPARPALPPRRRISHFVMNLPDSAITFLDAFRGILSSESLGREDISEIYNVMPMVHCYCFTRELEFDKAEVDIRKVRLFSVAAFMALMLYIYIVRGSKKSWGIVWATQCLFIWCGLLPRIKICIVSASDCPE